MRRSRAWRKSTLRQIRVILPAKRLWRVGLFTLAALMVIAGISWSVFAGHVILQCPRIAHAAPEITAAEIDHYLEGKNSPLAGYGEALIDSARRWDVDPRLVIAIAGAETSFGTRICADHNAWNWFYVDTSRCSPNAFASWADGIEQVMRGLRRSYLDRGRTTIPTIAEVYTATDREIWINNVTQFYQNELGGDPNDLTFVEPTGLPPLTPVPRATVEVTDEPRRVENPDEIPWRAIADLDYRFAASGLKGFVERSSCTGFFVGPHTVVTSAHCIYDHDKGGYVAAVNVMPGRNGGDMVGSQEVTTISLCVPKEWVDSRDLDYDYGVITLPDDTLGNKVGFWFTLIRSSADLPGQRVNLSGYPWDKPDNPAECSCIVGVPGCKLACRISPELCIPGCQLWTDAGPVKDYVTPARKFISYDVYATEGQSGSPVWYSDADGAYNVVSIAKGYDPNLNLTGGPVVTEEVISFIEAQKAIPPPEENLLSQVKEFKTDRPAWLYNFAAKGQGRILVKVDGKTIIDIDTPCRGEQPTAKADRVQLRSGCHQLEIRYEPGQALPQVGYGLWPDAANFDVQWPQCSSETSPEEPPPVVLKTDTRTFDAGLVGGAYNFAVRGEGRIRVLIDGKQVIDTRGLPPLDRTLIPVVLTKGCHDVTIEYEKDYQIGFSHVPNPPSFEAKWPWCGGDCTSSTLGLLATVMIIAYIGERRYRLREKP